MPEKGLPMFGFSEHRRHKFCARSSPQTSGDVLRNNQKLIKTVMMQYMQAIQIGGHDMFDLFPTYLLSSVSRASFRKLVSSCPSQSYERGTPEGWTTS